MRKQTKGNIHEIFLRVHKTGDKVEEFLAKMSVKMTSYVVDNKEDKFSGSQGRRKFQRRDDHRADKGKG